MEQNDVSKWTLKDLAAKLNGREIGEEADCEVYSIAKTIGAVICYGASDDLCEFSGAWDDERGCFDGGDIYITPTGIFEGEGDCDYAEDRRRKCKHYLKERDNAAIVTAVWCGEIDGVEWPWSYKTDIPHETFRIYEDKEPHCMGIVFFSENAKKVLTL